MVERKLRHLIRIYITSAAVIGGLILVSRAEAQQAPGGTDASQASDSVEVARARPPPRPPFDGYDALALPFRVATYPIKLFGVATAWAMGQLTKPGPTPAYMVALKDVSDWGLVPKVHPIGLRSGFAVQLSLIRFRPFFLQTAYSIRYNQRHRAGLTVGDRRRGATLAYTFTRNAQPHFWGIGSRTRKEDRSDYLWDQSEVALSARMPVHPHVQVAGGIAFEDNRVGRGFDGEKTDLQDTFAGRLPFGAKERTKYFRFELATTLDLTRWRGLQQRGLWVRLGSALFSGTDGTDSDFHKFDGELHGYLPLNSRQQLAVRGLIEINRGDSGRGVPFIHLASAGSTNGQRGFSTGRFRERDMVALMAEWRYEIWRDLHDRGRVESFVFVDESGVERSLSELDSSDLRTGYGLGMRVVWGENVAFVWYLGLSEEATRFRIKLEWPY